MDNLTKLLTYNAIAWLILLLSVSTAVGKHFSLTIKSEGKALKKFMQVVESCLVPPARIEILDNQNGTTSLRLILPTDHASSHDVLHILYTLNIILGDSAKSFTVKLVDNDPNVLIGDVVKSTIDIGDILNFGIYQPLHINELTSEKILLHELYEQFYLQCVKKINPASAKKKLIVEAHARASQLESNHFNLFMVKTCDAIRNNHIYIEFTHRANPMEKIIIIAFFKRGNITSVEKFVPFEKSHLIWLLQ